MECSLGFWVFWWFWSWSCFVVRHYTGGRKFISVIINCYYGFFWYWDLIMVMMMMVMAMVWMWTIICITRLIWTWVRRYWLCFISCMRSSCIRRWISCSCLSTIWSSRLICCCCLSSIWVSRWISCSSLVCFHRFCGSSIISRFSQTSLRIYFWI